jgi:hypothetical protein
MTTRSYIILALLSALFPLNEAYKILSTAEATKTINIWWGLDFPLTKDWFVKFLCLQVALLISSAVNLLMCKGKEPIVRSMCWLWFAFNVFELDRFFLNFNKDNYMVVYFLLPTLFFLIAAIIKHHSKYDIVYQVRSAINKSSINDWYYNGWKVGHYNYLNDDECTLKPRKRKSVMVFNANEFKGILHHSPSSIL